VPKVCLKNKLKNTYTYNNIFYINILKLLAYLILSAFINYIKNKFFKNIKNINNNKVIKVNIIF
jgi:hypothetical protein